MSADRDGFVPGKLWSLWGMLELRATPFVSALQVFASLNQYIRTEGTPEWPFERLHSEVDKGTRKELRKQVKTLAECCQTFGADLSGKAVERLRLALGRSTLTFDGLSAAVRNLNALFRDEIENSRTFVLEARKGSYFTNAAAAFGMEAVFSFPKAEYDLEEAAKAYAVSRNTACVFHLMRAMEVVVTAAGTALDVTVIDKHDQDLEWGKIVGNIGQAVEALPKGDKRAKWSATHSLLYHVKEAWRNPTMHPGQKYTDDEAREVLEAVKAFIRHLATLVDPWSAL